MCRSLISVDYQGYVYDCDFNQMLHLPLGPEPAAAGAPRPHLRDLLGLRSPRIATARALLWLHRRAGLKLWRRVALTMAGVGIQCNAPPQLEPCPAVQP